MSDQKRSGKTHASSADPDAQLYKKSYRKGSKLSYPGPALVESRDGLITAAMVTLADGYPGRDVALLMHSKRATAPPETYHNTVSRCTIAKL